MTELVKNDISRPFSLITGSTGDLGEVFCTLLAQRGFDLLMVGRNRDKLNALSNMLEKNFKISASPLPCDLANMTKLPSFVPF